MRRVHMLWMLLGLLTLTGCALPQRPIADAVSDKGVVCFVGEVNSAFTRFTSCEVEQIRKETKSAEGADLIWFKPLSHGSGAITVSELFIRRVVSPSLHDKGKKDTVRKYRAVFDAGRDKYSYSLHVDDERCTYSFRIGKDDEVRVWRLTHANVFRARSPGLSPQNYCSSEMQKWKEPRAYIRVSLEKN